MSYLPVHYTFYGGDSERKIFISAHTGINTFHTIALKHYTIGHLSDMNLLLIVAIEMFGCI